jgi:hypothetical protein
MAIIKQGILGGFLNKVGTAWKGRAVMRAMPLSVANPRTAAQIGNRQTFKVITKVASQLLGSVIVPLCNKFAGNISEWQL